MSIRSLQRNVLPLSLAIVFAFSALTGCSKESKLAAHLERGQTFLSENKLSEAEIEFKNALQIDQANAHAFSGLGQIFFKEGSYRQAFAHLERAIEISPDDLEANQALAQILVGAGDAERAMEISKAVLAKSPTASEALLTLANSALRLDKIEETEAFLSSLPNPGPATAASETARGILKAGKNDYDTALALFNSAIAIDPKFIPAHISVSNIQWARKNVAEAESTLKAAAKIDPKNPTTTLRLAPLLISQKRLPEAEEALNQSLTFNATNIPLLEALASVTAAQKKFADTKSFASRILKVDSFHFNGLQLLGKAMLSNGESDEAIKNYERAAELYPNSAEIQYQLALAYLSKQEPAKASASLTKATTIDPDHSQSVMLLAALNSRGGDPEKAIINLEKLVDADPENKQARLLLAQTLGRSGKFDQALALYSKLAEETPNSPQFPVLESETLVALRKPDLARAALGRALERAPHYPLAVEKLIDLDFADKNYEGALARIEGHIAAQPSNAFFYFLQGRIFGALKRLPDAEQALNQSLTLQKSGPASHMLGRLYLSTDRIDLALSMFEQARSIDKSDLESGVMAANLYERASNFEKARETYESILEVNPKHGAALNNLAYLYSEKFGNHDKGYELATKARQEMPNDPYTADTLGWIAYQRGEYQWASSILQEAARKLNQNAEVVYHLGMAQAKSKNPESKANLEKSIELGLSGKMLEEAKKALKNN